MTPDELKALTLASAARRIRDGSLSSVELTQIVLDRIAALNPKTNAYIAVTSDRALAEAERADKALESGQRVGLLHGVPLSIKDLIDTAGYPRPRPPAYLRIVFPPTMGRWFVDWPRPAPSWSARPTCTNSRSA